MPENCEIWQVLPVEKNAQSTVIAEFTSLESHVTLGVLSRILLDCKVDEQTGGTGEAFNWSLLDSISNKSVVVLAGGVSSTNIQAASLTGVGIIDVNSGVEDAPGHKTHAKLSELFARLRA